MQSHDVVNRIFSLLNCFFTGLTFCTLLSISNATSTYATENTIKQYKLGQINQLNISEPAGAKEASRTSLSWSFENLIWDPAKNKTNAIGSQKANTKNQILVSRGLFYPFGLGVAVAQSQLDAKNSYYQIAGYLQWTIFEAFALPAFSLRTKASRLNGPGLKHLDSLGFEFESSWGFRQVTFFAGQQVSLHFFSLQEGDQKHSPNGGLSLNSDKVSPLKLQTGYDGHWGVHFQIVPGLFSLAIDHSRTSQTKHFRGKISYEF